MSSYRRAFQQGGCYFFTVVTQNRRRILTDPVVINRLRDGFRRIKAKHPFDIDAIVILPDHLHCIWRLPQEDVDFPKRWRLIKHYVSIGTDSTVNARGEKNLWQRRYWEHLIRDEKDWRRHMDYIHYNPVKHGLVAKPREWPHGSFRHAVTTGLYLPTWGTSEPTSIEGMNFE